MFDRGFKTWCERVALEQRKALGLRPTDPLDAERLAAHMGIQVHTPEEVPGVDAASLRALRRDGGGWSAVTISMGSRAVIVLNSSHSGGRSASDLMHELSHRLIGHQGAGIHVTDDGLLLVRTYDKKQEAEATWLGGCLLVPRDALLFIQKRRLDGAAAARTYGISLDMLDYRMKVTGVVRQTSRWGSRRAG